jgi:hypothetical protein
MPETRSQTLKQQLQDQERKKLLTRDRKFANENLEFYTRRLNNIHEDPDVNGSYLKGDHQLNINRMIKEYWIGVKAGLDDGLTIGEQVEIKKKKNEELKRKNESCIVSGGRRYKRTIKRRKLTKRRNLKSRKVK